MIPFSACGMGFLAPWFIALDPQTHLTLSVGFSLLLDRLFVDLDLAEERNQFLQFNTPDCFIDGHDHRLSFIFRSADFNQFPQPFLVQRNCSSHVFSPAQIFDYIMCCLELKIKLHSPFAD
jgi:hypothetical protein